MLPCFIELRRHHFSLNCRFHVKASVTQRYRSCLCNFRYVLCSQCICDLVCICARRGGWGVGVRSSLFPHLLILYFFSSFPISEAFDSVLLLNSSWNSSISKSSSSLPSSFPGRVLAKSGRGTAHQRLAAISRGPHVSNSGQPWLQTGTLKQATTRPVIPVSTLVSGIDNGPIHLGPLKLAWHFKGEDREPGQPDTACKRVEPRKGGMGGGKGLFGM